MKKLLIIFGLTLLTWTAKGQYPFEKYPSIKYKEHNDWKTYDDTEKEKKVHSTLTIPNFFENEDTLTIQLTSFTDHWWDNSIIRIYHNKTEVQKIIENTAFNPIGLDTLRVADINGDGLQDLKIISAYMGNGTAAINVKIVYLFQQRDHSFKKISFADKMSNNRPERDFDGDGNFEIVTMNLVGYQDHSYWLFNIFNYKNDELVNSNIKDNYPIMIQFLYRDNYEITNKISREKMKGFSLTLPDEYHKK
ncbi:hypothetical protein D3C85_705820 [compost metagenome]